MPQLVLLKIGLPRNLSVLCPRWGEVKVPLSVQGNSTNCLTRSDAPTKSVLSSDYAIHIIAIHTGAAILHMPKDHTSWDKNFSSLLPVCWKRCNKLSRVADLMINNGSM